MTLLQAMKASVTYQGVLYRPDVEFCMRIRKKRSGGRRTDAGGDGVVCRSAPCRRLRKGTGIVTKVQECREPSGKGQLHLRWVEFFRC